ncbi:MAG TPA: Lrp/AsnC family transcriptional regulator [Aquamicrobium sp.]|nr:Lrp/AsnC family transcriptional regulator [Aquamicrobium sp.]
MKLSLDDYSIISLIQDDARMSISKVAKLTNMPESTARHKLNRLVDSGVISFVALSDPIKLGYKTWVALMLEIDVSQLKAAAEKIASFKEVYFVAVTNGNYQLQVSAVFRSNDEYVRFMTDDLAKIGGLKSINTYNYLSVIKRSMAMIPPEEFIEDDQ